MKMMIGRIAAAALISTGLTGMALADITIGVTVSSTGPGAALGIPLKNSVELWPTEIDGEKLNVIVLDDAGDPSMATTNARRFANDDKADVIVGSALTPASIAISSVAAESGIPHLACSPVPPNVAASKWTFVMPQDAGLINRLGFNSDGHAAVRERLRSLARQRGVLGVNIGANKDSADRIADYARGLEAFWGLADYFTVNISSPNTPDLRRLQARGELVTLLTSLNEARDRLTDARGKRPPVLIKIAPDVTERELEDIAEACLTHGADGAIVSNTTISRDGLASAHASEAGGLSGAPLFALSTRVLARLHRLTEGRLPLVGVGGVTSGEAAYAKIKAGASLVQLYTALTYQGPALIARIKRDLVAFMERDGITSIGDATGVEAERYAQ